VRQSERSGSAAWLAAFREQESVPGRAGQGLDLLVAPPDWHPSVAETPSCRVIFDGVLYDQDALREQFAEHLPREPTCADLVGQAYGRWGEDTIARLKGVFALIIADRSRDLLLCARDPLGIRPLFYAVVNRALLLSPSIETLLGQAGLSSELNRACLVDHLTKRWPANDETYFTRVRRVPPGHVMRVVGHDRRLYRYWSPVPADGLIEWIPDDEVQERFEALLGRAVARCLAPGPAGVYTSGGLDSSTLAMVATDLSCAQGSAPPCALSLVFSETDLDEAALQRGLAAELGLSQVQLPFEHAVGPEGTLGAALEMTLMVENRSPTAFVFQEALHTYLHVGDAEAASVHGRVHFAQAASSRPSSRVAQANAKATAKPTYPRYRIGGWTVSAKSCNSGLRSLPSIAAGTRRSNGLDVVSMNSWKPMLINPRMPMTRLRNGVSRLPLSAVTASDQAARHSDHSSSEPSCAPQTAATR